MEDKLKALANEMMETFQKQGLTCDEVSVIMMNVSMRVSDAKKEAASKALFKGQPF